MCNPPNEKSRLATAALSLSTASNINGINSVTIILSTEKKPQISSDFSALPAILIERLAAENVFSADDWCRLNKRQRNRIFGITPSHIAIINRAAGVHA